MPNSPGRWGRRQAAKATIGGALATGVVALAFGTPAAGAAVTPIGGGTLDWGTKQSFRNYVEGPIAHGEITTAGGATRNADGTFRWPVTGGQFDAAAETGEVRSAGTARFYGHNGMLELEITNPRVMITGETGVLHADVRSRSLSSGQMESFPNVDLASLDLSAIAPVLSADGFSYAAVPATLTANGAPAFAGFYPAGTAMDPVSVAAAYGSGGPPAQPGVGPEIRVAGKPQKLNRSREARVARITCNTGPCALEVPAKVKAKIAGAQYEAKVLAPSSVAAGATAKVSVKLSRKAAKALSGEQTKVKVPITATAPQTGAYAQAIAVSERAKVEIKEGREVAPRAAGGGSHGSSPARQRPPASPAPRSRTITVRPSASR